MNSFHQCIINCCSQNITTPHLQAFIQHPETRNLVQRVARKHFPNGRNDFNGSVVSGHDELLSCSLGTIFTALLKPRKETGEMGFPNTWQTMSYQQTEANLSLWIHGRLYEDVNRGHTCGARRKKSTMENGRLRQVISLSCNDENGQESQQDVPLYDTPEFVFIRRLTNQKRQQMVNLVESAPLVAMSIMTERVQSLSEVKWTLIPQVNATSLCKWLMSNPKTCEDSLIESIWPTTKFTSAQYCKWTQNRPSMKQELISANAAHGKITKEFTVLTLTKHPSIQVLRSAKDATKHRESLRKNTNLTESGIYWLCLIAALRLHGTNIEGMTFHRELVSFFLDKAALALPKIEIDFQTLVMDFVENHSLQNKEVRISTLLPLVSLLRYGDEIDNLTQNKRDNLRRIILIASHIGRQLCAQYSMVPISK